MHRGLLRALVLTCIPMATLAAGATAPAAAPASAPAPAPTAPTAAAVPAPETTYAYLKVPMFGEEFASLPIAQVDDEVIVLQELTDALAAAHGAMGDMATEKKAGKRDFQPVLDRLVEARLLTVEAREMGIADLPEHKAWLESYKEATGREMLQAIATKGVQADPAVVERVFQDAVREWKVKSVLVREEADAKALAATAKAGAGAGAAFDTAAAKLVADKKAKGGETAEYLPRAKLLPEILAALERMKVGDVGTPIKVKDGFAVMHVEEVRYPESAEARAKAQSQAYAAAIQAAVKKYYAGLVKEWVKVDEALLVKVDFEAARPGIEALAKDQRVVARIKGAKPITVAEIAAELQGSFFHGVENAAKEKKANRSKLMIVDALISRRVVPLEVARLRIPESAEFKRRVASKESQTLFSRFLEKVVIPEVKVGDAESKKFYDEHAKEFTFPAFYSLESLAFREVKPAQSAVDKLRGGTDFKWLNANSEGQLKPAERKVQMDGTFMESAMPKELVKALAGAKKGDVRLFQSGDDEVYVVHVMDLVEPRQQTYDEVKAGLEQRVWGDALAAAIKDWAAKLRKARDVKVYLTKLGS